MKKNFTLNFACINLVVCLLLLNSCSKNSINPTATFKGDVYIAGLVNPAAGPLAAYWKNNKMKQLSNELSQAFAIAVSDTNVYIAGYMNSTGTGVYWKNDTRTALPYLNALEAIPYSITVSGSDVFIGGNLIYVVDGASPTTITKAAYWKNDKVMQLSDSQSNVTAIAVLGSDVYVVGNIAHDSSNVTVFKPALWKNGILKELSTANGGTTAIAFSGSDVYIAGSVIVNQQSRAVYWKNGVMNFLADGFDPNGIAVSGSNVYVSGSSSINGNACYWANGAIAMLAPDKADASSHSSGIAVHGSDVYVSGNIIDNSGQNAKVVYWKNGVMETMPDDVSDYAISYAMTIH
ncbi:MAG: hypothetical protein OJF59_000622 [Cytophagales bacterium]|jgi:hypothetical protein|nr:MAG: hypothetical protein OJF59_000622 [Cytophagales bacterium]